MTISQTMGQRPRRLGRKQRRMVLIALAGAVLAAAATLVLIALSDRIVFFSSPSDIRDNPPEAGQRIRLGGLVAIGSVERREDGLVVFAVTDGEATIMATYRGILPDLFREGTGVVTEGVLGPDGRFAADTVLAKHDEAYMPAEVVDALRATGHWEGDNPAAAAPPMPVP